jgi:hypothetical protein
MGARDATHPNSDKPTAAGLPASGDYSTANTSKVRAFALRAPVAIAQMRFSQSYVFELVSKVGVTRK